MVHLACGRVVLFTGLIGLLVPALAVGAPRRAAGGPPPAAPIRHLATDLPQRPLAARTVYVTPAAPVDTGLDDGIEPAASGSVRRLLIVVNDSLYESIDDLLDVYIADVEGEGYTVELVELSGGTAAGLRSLLQAKYAQADSLEAVYLIGNLVVPWFRHPNDYNEGGSATFPCELFLMDMDGAWTDTDGDGYLDLHTAGTGDEGPEIYTGRTVAHNLTLESGQTQVSLIRRYLTKVHDWRLGVVTSNVKACLYTDDDWAWWHTDYSTACGYAWTDREDYYEGAETIASDYKVKLQTPYEHMRLGCHSWSGGHSFKIGSEWTGGSVYSSDIVNTPPKVIYYNLYACSNALWTDSNCMGVWYTMNRGPGLGAIGSTKTGGMNENGPYYQPIGQFYPIGYAAQNWFDSFQPYDNGERSWTFGMMWLGDPTLWRTRVAPGTFALAAPASGTQYAAPDLWLSWGTSVPVGVYETVTYRLSVDNNEQFTSPELVVDGLTDTSYHITAADGLTGLRQYWKVEAVTNFGKVRPSSSTRWFTIALDTDNDGMPDDWETTHGLDPFDPTDAMRDADGDLLLNVEELELGSDPRSGDSPAMLYVDAGHSGGAPNGSPAQPFGAIQAAIDAAVAPTVVRVLPGTYTEHVVMADSVWLLGSGSNQTLLASPGGGPAVFFDGVQGGLIAGFTIAAGPSDVLIRSWGSTTTVRDCTCTGGLNGIGADISGSIKIINCLLADNTSNGIYIGGTVLANLTNCTIANNAANGAKVAYRNSVDLENSILWGNGADLSISSSATVTARYCNIGDGTFAGTQGCIAVDPHFVNGPLHDYYLSQTAAGQALNSPCVDAGNPLNPAGLDRQTTRTDGVRDTGIIDMGCHMPYALSISSITASSPVTIEWNAQPGLQYVVEWSTDLQIWSEVEAGAVSSWTDPDTTGAMRKFYRVREK
ncbi:MAG: right-handed parallel beta-helix repeat-containing protein [Verrucomicrobia bacterium]|nr:right-handed parallel beta-helix repeat-containing protein [Verrucomicrobiota bacterium]